jgi:hypothetical protein
MTDLVRWDLCGPVRTLGARVAEWNREADDWRPMKSRFVATFRPDGSLSEIEYHNPDGSIPREVRVYDEAGRLTEAQWRAKRRADSACRPHARRKWSSFQFQGAAAQVAQRVRVG